jgi:hypothetical protein
MTICDKIASIWKMIPFRGMNASEDHLASDDCAFVDAWIGDLMAWMGGRMEARILMPFSSSVFPFFPFFGFYWDSGT